MNGKTVQVEGIKVKNTFIDFDAEDEDDVPSAGVALSKRQFSEPALMGRQMTALRQCSSGMHAQMEAVGEEEQDDEQDGEDADLNGTSPLNRQVTELHWPTWATTNMPQMQTMPMIGLEAWAPPYPFGGVDAATLQQMGKEQDEWAPQGGLPLQDRALGLVAQPSLPVQAKIDPEPTGQDVPPDWCQKTTVMLRNLPNKYSQQMLLEELNSSGFLGTFDFLYLPIDPETNANRGYCFINFTDPNYAWSLKLTYEGRKMGRFNSDKVVFVAPAALQGFEANYAHYSTARVNRGDPSTRPLFLREAATGGQDAPPRRRGGRRSQGSLIDIAARQQKKHTQPAQAATFSEGYIGLQAGGAAMPSSEGKKGGGKSGGKGGKAGQKSSEQPSQDSLKPRFCPFCGGEAKPDFRFCQFCGASLNFGAEG